jgi:hypothetical protein
MPKLKENPDLYFGAIAEHLQKMQAIPQPKQLQCSRCGLKLNEFFKKFKACPLCISHGVVGTIKLT